MAYRCSIPKHRPVVHLGRTTQAVSPATLLLKQGKSSVVAQTLYALHECPRPGEVFIETRKRVSPMISSVIRTVSAPGLTRALSSLCPPKHIPPKGGATS